MKRSALSRPPDDTTPVTMGFAVACDHGWLRSTRATVQMSERAQVHLSLRVRSRQRQRIVRPLREHELGQLEPGLLQFGQRGHADRGARFVQMQHR